MAINLIDKMHEMYLCDRVTIDITKTLDIILQEQEKKNNISNNTPNKGLTKKKIKKKKKKYIELCNLVFRKY